MLSHTLWTSHGEGQEAVQCLVMCVVDIVQGEHQEAEAQRAVAQGEGQEVEEAQCVVVRGEDIVRGEGHAAEAEVGGVCAHVMDIARGEHQEAEAWRAVMRGEGREAEEVWCVIMCGEDIVRGEGCAVEVEVGGVCVHVVDIAQGEHQEAEAWHAVTREEGQEVEEVQCVVACGEDIMHGEGCMAEAEVGGACVRNAMAVGDAGKVP